MALDFPTSPTVGQQYGGYVFDGVKWKVSTTSTAPASVQPTPPTNPTVGDMWFNSTDGTMYFYYNDGNTSQWVESRAPITANGYYSPNYVINGAFDIWQRGTSGTVGGSVGFAADRWQSVTYAGGTMYWLQVAAGTNPAGCRYALRVQRASGATNTATMNIAYSLETQDVIKLAGKTVTWSFYARKGSTYSPTSYLLNARATWGTNTDTSIFTGGISGGANIVDSTVTLTDNWVRYNYTFTIPTNATSFGITWYSSVTGTAGAADYYDITGVQLEEGSAATTFRRNANSLQGELAACQRYYQRMQSWNSYGYFSSALGNVGAGSVRGPLDTKVTLRTFPTSVEWGGSIMTEGEGVNRTITSIGIENNVSTPTRPVMTFGISGTNPTNGMYQVIANNNSASYIGISAEL